MPTDQPATTTVDLDGKVAIVTGAGRGLGRAEALELARHGTRVVVNDYGLSLDGRSNGDSPAHAVATEIRDAGGQAVAHLGDIADFDDAEQLVRTAVDEFGQLDILVNNAGILRDRMIFAMSEEEFDAVVRVHLKGHFCPSRHATAYWRDRSKRADAPVYARVVNTSSEAFLLGSPGQPNYAAAKGGIIGLTMSTAFGCARYGVRANVICPRAHTRMTEGVLGGSGELAPEHVAPLVAVLASPTAERITGQVFVAYGPFVGLMGASTLDHRFDADGAGWRADDLVEAIDTHFDQRDPKRTFSASDLMDVE